jgi:hypothetical protein
LVLDLEGTRARQVGTPIAELSDRRDPDPRASPNKRNNVKYAARQFLPGGLLIGAEKILPGRCVLDR